MRLIFIIVLFFCSVANAVTLRVWAKDGTLLNSITTATSNGHLEYLGGNQFVIGLEASATLEFATYNGVSLVTTRTATVSYDVLTASGGGVSTVFGVRCIWSWLEEDRDTYCSQLYILFRGSDCSGGPCAAGSYIAKATLNGAVSSALNIGTSLQAATGLTWDGHSLIVTRTNANNFRRYFTTGSSFYFFGTQAPGTNGVLDTVFDGKYMWFMERLNIHHYDYNQNADIKSWAHGATTPRGLATDGRVIFLLSAS